MFRFKQKLLLPTRREDMPNSPFVESIKGYAERRSQLFPDRRRIPARKAKAFLTLGLIFQMVGLQHIADIKKFMKRRDQDMAKIQRKATPFLQALSDVRYCALVQRKDMILKELFAYKGEEFYKSIENRFHQKDVWCPYTPRYPFMYNKTFRNVLPYNTFYYSRFSNSYDHYNI